MITFAIDLQILIACHQFDISSCTYSTNQLQLKRDLRVFSCKNAKRVCLRVTTRSYTRFIL